MVKPMKHASWLAVMMATMIMAGTPYMPGEEMALDATKWNFDQKEERRQARELLNSKTPRIVTTLDDD